MPKAPRPLGQDSPILATPKVHQGVRVDAFPSANLHVSMDEMLQRLEQPEAALPVESSPAPAAGQQGFQDIPVGLIDDSPFQPRLEITEEEQEQLTVSIAVAGRVNRPLLLRRKANGRFELIGGACRLKSVRSLGWATAPARIIDVDDAEAEILAVSDNEGHIELSDFEKGRQYARILARGKIKSQRELAARLGSSPATVTRCLAFMKLPPDCVSFLERKPRTLGSKLIVEFVEAGEKSPELTIEALTKIDQEGASQDAALRWLNAAISGKSGQASPQKEVTKFELSGGMSVTMTQKKDSISLKLPKGINMEAVQAAIKTALAGIAETEKAP